MKPSNIKVLTIKVASFEVGVMRSVIRKVRGERMYAVSFFIRGVKQPWSSTSNDLRSAYSTAAYFVGVQK